MNYCCSEDTCMVSMVDCLRPELVGDGMCHPENNNDNCQYDGGDCCLGEMQKCSLECRAGNCFCHNDFNNHCEGIKLLHFNDISQIGYLNRSLH